MSYECTIVKRFSCTPVTTFTHSQCLCSSTTPYTALGVDSTARLCLFQLGLSYSASFLLPFLSLSPSHLRPDAVTARCREREHW